MNILPYTSEGALQMYKLRILRWGDDRGLARWTQCHFKGSYSLKRKVGGRERVVLTEGD